MSAYIACAEASDVRVAGPRVFDGGPRGVHGVHENTELSQIPPLNRSGGPYAEFKT